MQDYYGELQKGLMCCAIVEGTEDAICRFYSGLRRDIQDIVDYKEFHTVNQLFQFAMLVEKELQGHDLQSRSKATYTPRSEPSSGLTKPASFRLPHLRATSDQQLRKLPQCQNHLLRELQTQVKFFCRS